MYDRIMIRFGDSTLKGKNKHRFIESIINLIKQKVNHEGITYEREFQSLMIILNTVPHEEIIPKLSFVSGIKNYSLVKTCEKTLTSIHETAANLIEQNIASITTFKVETKRADQSFPVPSMEVSRKVGGSLLKRFPQLKVDVVHPKTTLHIEIRQNTCFVFIDKITGLGGFPVGIAGKGLLLLSGGIDSPVAGFLSMKQGIKIEAIHFESSPLTSLESVQKVIDITKNLCHYAPNDTIDLHIFPFKEIHQAILEYVPTPYHIIIMRRMMMRIGSLFAALDHTPVLLTGESIGQVASQTLESIHVINAVTTIPILRPLITLDKNDIITLSKRINCYDISIRPFEDCCTIYVPKNPTTSPREQYALRYEKLFDYKKQIEKAIENKYTLTITKDTTLNLMDYGFTLEMALNDFLGGQHD